MSRDANILQRHINDCLADRHEKRDWMERARGISWNRVTESDWARYGNMTPEGWWETHGLDAWDPRDDWDWGDETWDAPELHEHEWGDWLSLEREEYDPRYEYDYDPRDDCLHHS